MLRDLEYHCLRKPMIYKNKDLENHVLDYEGFRKPWI